MAEVGSVEVPLKLKGADAFKKGIDGAANSMGGLGASATASSSALMGFTVAAAAVTAASTALVSALKGISAAGAEVEQGLAGIAGTMKIDKASDAYKKLAGAAKQAGIETQFSPKEAIAGLGSMATQGLSAEQATAALLPVLDLAAGSLGQLGVAGAADAVVGTLKSYGMSVDDAGKVTDKLLRITQLTNFQTKDFGVALSKVAAIGGSFNQSLDDMVIGVGLIRDKNIDASIAASALSTATLTLSGDQKRQQLITKQGVAVHDAQTGAMRSMLDIITDLSKATEKMTTKERDAMLVKAFGVRGILAFTAISKAQTEVIRNGEKVTLKGAEAIRHLRNEMGNAEGTAAAFKAVLEDTFAGQMTLLAGSVETLMSEIGGMVNVHLRPMVEGFKDFVNEILDLLMRMSPELKDIIAQITVFGTAGAVAMSSILVVGGSVLLLLATLPKLILAAKSGFALLGGSALVSFAPIIATMAGILVILANVRLLFGRTAEAAEDAGGRIEKETSSWSRWFAEALVAPWTAVLSVASVTIGAIAKAFAKLIGVASAGIEKLFEGVRAVKMATGGDTKFWDMQIAGIKKTRKFFNEYELDVLGLAQEGFKKLSGGRSATDVIADVLGASSEGAVEAVKTGVRGTIKGLEFLKDDAIEALGIDQNIFKLKDLEDKQRSGALQLEKATQELAESLKKGANVVASSTGGEEGLDDEDRRARQERRRHQQEVLKRRQQRLEEMQAAAAERNAPIITGFMDIIGAATTGLANGIASAIDSAGDMLTRVESGIGDALNVVGMFKSGGKGLFEGAGGMLGGAIAGPLGKVIGSGVGEFLEMAMPESTTNSIKHVFDSLVQVFEPILSVLAPLFMILGDIIGGILGPTFMLLGEAAELVARVFFFVLKVVGTLAITLGNAGAVLITAIIDMAAAIADFFGFDGFAQDAREFAQGIRDAVADVAGAVAEADFDDAMARAANGANNMARAADRAAEALLNVPTGFKVQRARFGAAQGAVMDDFLMRPGQPAVPFSSDDTILGMKDFSSLGGGSTVYIENVNVQADDPSTFFRKLQDMVNADNLRGGINLGGNWQGRP